MCDRNDPAISQLGVNFIDTADAYGFAFASF
jgi:aryl-alcohol dehydrogenase-like predicted oxidoreductase